MQYNYITENNLEYPQNYMYARYGGMDFLSAYMETRRRSLAKHAKNEEEPLKLAFSMLHNAGGKLSPTTAQLASICQDFSENPIPLNRRKIDWYLQRFEVRKRLFAKYDPQTGKPIEQSGYDDCTNYILLSALSGEAYRVFRSLKYLNVFLKLNDTLLSLSTNMTSEQQSLLQALITDELEYIAELAIGKGIALQGGASGCF